MTSVSGVLESYRLLGFNDSEYIDDSKKVEYMKTILLSPSPKGREELLSFSIVTESIVTWVYIIT